MDEPDIWSTPCHQEFMRDLPRAFAIDSECTGLKWVDKAFGVSLAWYKDDVLKSGYIDIRYNSAMWLEIHEYITRTSPELWTWHGKFDFKMLNIYPQAATFQDGCLGVYCINENYPKKLKVVAQKLLKASTDEDEVLKRVRKEMGLTVADGYDKLPLSVIAPYAQRDAEYTARIWLLLEKVLKAGKDLWEVYSFEKQLILAVASTERRGIGVDTEYLKTKIVELGDDIITLEREIAEIVGKPVGNGKKKIRVPDGKYKNGRPKFRTEVPNEFNPNSPVQISEYFNSVGVEVSGTSEDVLETLSDPLAKALVRYRNLKKNRNTYLVPINEEAVWDEKFQCYVVHPNLNLTRTKTKRMSSSGASDG